MRNKTKQKKKLFFNLSRRNGRNRSRAFLCVRFIHHADQGSIWGVVVGDKIGGYSRQASKFQV